METEIELGVAENKKRRVKMTAVFHKRIKRIQKKTLSKEWRKNGAFETEIG